MANTPNTLKNAPGVVAKMAAAMFADKTVFCKSIDKAEKSDYDGKNGYNAGDTIYISKPARFTVGSTADITSGIQDVKEEKVALTLDTRKVVGIALTSAEIATELSLKAWAARVLEPAISAMAQDVEKTFIQKATQATANSVGTPGSTVFDTDLALSAGQKISENACPDLDGRFFLLNPAANRSAVNARKGLFQSSSEIASQYKKGYMGTADGFDYLTNNLTYNHTNGADVLAGVEATVLAIAEGATSIGLDGVASGATIKKGSVFTIASVNAVHPITKADLGYLKQFVVAADVTETASNQVTVTITEAIYSSASGALQNVSAIHADEAAVTFLGSASTSYGQSLAYHKSAFRMVSVPLVTPDGVDMSAQETVDGMTIRVVRDYDVLTDKLIMRLDFLGGLAAVRPEWAARAWA
jgi:hypothetical protein